MPANAVAKLVQRCLADVARKPVENVDIYIADEVTTWHLALHFPPEAPFTGGSGCVLKASSFSLYATLTFGPDFPARPPKFKFESKWINHQHLWGDRICHSLLSDDFLDFFRERRTHSTSLWNASCALSDEEGLGGMPRYLQILREFLGCDSDYDDEQHVKYDASSLEADVAAQRSFKPEWWEESSRLEPEASATTQPEAEAAQSKEEVWGIDFFSKEPMHVGDADRHPCFDVAENPGRVPSLSTSMACLSPQSFEMGAKTTDFGTPISVILPYPVSTEAWSAVGRSLAASGLAALAPLAEGMYQLKLNSCRSGDSATRFEGILNIIGEVWKTTCIGIVKDSNYESERAVMCFVTLHFLLLCLAQDHPQLREHTAATVREFLERIDAAPSENLKTAVPDLGRFLVRFLLTESELSLRDHLAPIVRELFRRNVRWVHPDHWADGDASEDEKEEQVDAAFEASQFGMKLLVFQTYYILRSRELGLDSMEALNACRGRPATDALAEFQTDCRAIKELGSYQEFFVWLQMESYLDRDLHTMLCEAVDESEDRGYNHGVPKPGGYGVG